MDIESDRHLQVIGLWMTFDEVCQCHFRVFLHKILFSYKGKSNRMKGLYSIELLKGMNRQGKLFQTEGNQKDLTVKGGVCSWVGHDQETERHYSAQLVKFD